MLMLICPVCRNPLSRGRASWSCAQGHSFDIAREGYINLLLVQQKKSRHPGDGRDSLVARRQFLQSGHYEPLRQAFVAMMPTPRPQNWLDVGCGEGYYTSLMLDHADNVMGLDIAKAGVQMAAHRYAGMTWVVASAAALPLASNSFDGGSSLFAPVPPDVVRVLRHGATLMVVTPDADHLLSVRQALFGEVRPHQPQRILQSLPEGLEAVSQTPISFELKLQQADLKSLLAMTPYAWKAKPERRAILEATLNMTTQAAFVLHVLRKQDEFPVIMTGD
ncbi:MAG: methyltransferase domain-containing protein [Pseudomonadales bacterium]|nr:methyltransferase domain-containing protein [Pseudomonadales bacterium]